METPNSPGFTVRPATRILFLMFSVAGMGLVGYATALRGPGLTPDSIGYQHLADQMAGQFRFDGALWPPLFPGMLALGHWLGITPAVWGGGLNLVAFGAILYLAGMAWFRLYPDRRLYLAFPPAILLMSFPLFYTSSYVWSENSFILPVLAAQLILHDYLKAPRPGLLCGAAGLTALACLSRYIGVTMILTAVLCVLFLNPGANWRRRIGHGFIFGVIASIPLAVWLLRNHLYYHTLAGTRPPSSHSPALLMEMIVRTAGVWFGTCKSWLSILIMAGMATMLSIGLVRFIQSGRALKRTIALRPLPWIMAVWIAVYLTFLVVSSLKIQYDLPNHRLLAPIFVQTMLLVLAGLVGAGDYLARFRFWRRSIHPVNAFGLLLWLGFYLMPGQIGQARLWRETGLPGYSHPSWDESALLAYVKANPLQGMVFSNDAFVLGHYTPCRAVQVYTPAILAEYLCRQKDQPVHLVWFQASPENENRGRPDSAGSYRAFYLSQIGRDAPFDYWRQSGIARFHLVAQVQDGAVYSLMATPSPQQPLVEPTHE